MRVQASGLIGDESLIQGIGYRTPSENMRYPMLAPGGMETRNQY